MGSFSGFTWWDGWRIRAHHCQHQTGPQGWLLAQRLHGTLREQQRVGLTVNMLIEDAGFPNVLIRAWSMSGARQVLAWHQRFETQ